MSGTHRSTSYWIATSEPIERPPLRGEARASVCVVGGGIAGLSAAYELARDGRDVLVIDSNRPGDGETGRTTAHLANAMDDRFVRLKRIHGVDGARKTQESHGAAIDRIETIVREEGIECAFRRLDGWLFPATANDRSLIADELDAAREAGITVERVERPPVERLEGPALRFPRQGQFHPLRYVAGLTAAIERRGGRIHGGTHAVDVEEGERGAPCRVVLRDGGEILCDHVVLATNSPARRYLVAAKMLPYHTFAIALRAPAGIPAALYWDTAEPYHYVRFAGIDAADREAVLIVGGGDYQTGTKDEGEDRFRQLEAWTRERFPGVGDAVARWSGQVLEPADSLAFIGRAPGAERVWFATGDSGQGMTHGALAGMLLRDLILGRENPWADLYSPSRVKVMAAKNYMEDGVKMGRQYLDWLAPAEVDSEAEVRPGHGAVLRQGVRPVAVYRRPDGSVLRRSAVCTHMGCVVHWNSTERSWDCPCHGSRYDPEGQVLNGPAARALDPIEE